MSESNADTNADETREPNNSKTSSIDQTTTTTTKVVNRAPKQAKNWDKICNELLAEDKEEEGVDDMFKKLYDSGDDDTRRAMKKSLYESKGTTLSMNWKEVGSKFVKPYEDKDKDKSDDDDDDVDDN